MSSELYTLAYLTEYPKINQILQGVVGIFEKVFPRRIRGYYLQGSFGNRSTVINSDLDIYVIFKESFISPEEATTAASLSQSCAQISSVLLEIKSGPELYLYRAEHAGIALNFKYSTQFLYGEDIRDKVPTFTSDDWIQWAIKVPQTSLRVIRSAKVLIFPLQQPDAKAEFYGYDRQMIPCPDGIDRPSSKWLVATVGWIATALVAYRTKQYVGSKGEATQLYKTHISDEWAALVEQVYEECRNHWNYLIPDREAERQKLRLLCRNTLRFSNHYLSIYRNFMLCELHERTRQHQLFAVKNLAQVIYPDDQEIANALNGLQQSSDEELRKAACETKDRIKQALDLE